jgi:hypothetical protein
VDSSYGFGIPFRVNVKVKVNVKLSLCFSFNEHQAMKAYWGMEVQLHAFFDLGTRWRLEVSFTPRPLYSQGKSP